MGKRIIQQARGHGSLTYRVRRKAFMIKPKYPAKLSEEYEVIKLINSGGHTAPIAKLKSKRKEVEGKDNEKDKVKGNENKENETIFYNIAAKGMYEGQIIKINSHEEGDVAMTGDLKNGASIFNIENKPGDGGKFVRSGGGYATITSKKENVVTILMPSKKEKKINSHCRASVGVVAGSGRVNKPILKAGKKYYMKKVKSKLWPRTSAVKMNAIDHPFGGGRGKRIKSKIAKRNAPPGRKVGLLRPRRTGRKKK